MTTPHARLPLVLLLAVGVALLLAVAAWRALGRVGEPVEPGLQTGVGAVEPGTEAVLVPGAVDSPEAAPPVPEFAGARAPVAAAPRSSLDVRLVDEHTGEPLPWFRLGLRPLRERDAPLEWHETDAGGRFRSETDWAGRDLKVELVDVEGAPWYGATTFAVLRFDADAGTYPDELAIESGPTYHLRVDPPVAPLEATLTGWEPDPTQHVNYIPVRDGDMPWVRFRDRWNLLEGSAWLEVRVVGGHLSGAAFVEQLAGIVDAPVHVSLAPTASLAGRLALPGGGPPPDGALLHLVRRGERRTWRDVHGDRELWLLRGFADDGDGRFLFDHIAPGAYDLLVAEYGLDGGPFEVDLPPGPTDLGEMPVRARPVAGPVRGKLVSTSGYYEGSCHVGLWPVGGMVDVLLDESIDWGVGPDGRLFAPFAFEDVPAGEYFVYVDCHDLSDWGEAVPIVSPPVEDLEIVLPHDPLTIVFRVLAAESGEPLEPNEVSWELRGEEGWLDPVVEDVVNAAAVSGIRWTVRAPGRVPRRGGGEVFGEPVLEGGALLSYAEVVLQRGWGDWLEAREAGTDEPLEGVEFLVDGRSAGWTGADGTLWVEAPGRPAQIEARLTGWEDRTGVFVNPDTGEDYWPEGVEEEPRLSFCLRHLP